MRLGHRVADVRAAEARLMASLPAGTLMHRAATGLATVCAGVLGRVYGARVVLLVGSGDNGGDALFAGAQLARRGARVDALVLNPERVHDGGLAALRAAGGGVGTDPEVVDRADLVLDGIVGIGAVGGLRPGAAELAARAVAGPGLIVAVDLPSGVDADTGQVAGAAVRADATVTFGTWKPGLVVDPGAAFAGATTLVDIGLGPYLPQPAVRCLQDADLPGRLPVPGRNADKYRRGVVGVCAGSATYPGAAVLAVAGAIAGGCGMVRFSGPPPAAAAVSAAFPEVIVTTESPQSAGRVQAWVVGCGLGLDAVAQSRLKAVFDAGVPVVVDADALTLVGRYPDWRPQMPTLLTPHAGELGRLLGVEVAAVQAARLAHARRVAQRFDATVALKGSTTVVVGPAGPDGEEQLWVNARATPWLATAGSGDVLAGLAGALLAVGFAPTEAGALAAHLHGAAGQEVAGAEPGVPVTASAVAAAVAAGWRLAAGSLEGPDR